MNLENNKLNTQLSRSCNYSNAVFVYGGWKNAQYLVHQFKITIKRLGVVYIGWWFDYSVPTTATTTTIWQSSIVGSLLAV